MDTSFRVCVKRALMIILLAAMTVFSTVSEPAAAPVTGRGLAAPVMMRNTDTERDSDMNRILSALERRIGSDRRLLEKTKEKLFTLSREDIQLITSLCDRMPGEDGEAGAEIAFLLITALIVMN